MGVKGGRWIAVQTRRLACVAQSPQDDLRLPDYDCSSWELANYCLQAWKRQEEGRDTDPIGPRHPITYLHLMLTSENLDQKGEFNHSLPGTRHELSREFWSVGSDVLRLGMLIDHLPMMNMVNRHVM